MVTRRAPRRTQRAELPAFALYGEARAAAPAMLHVESIASRSRLYDWEIDSHVHHGLHQLLWLRAGPVQARLDESRTDAEGPLAIAIPPAVAHAFRFTPQTDGMVLTLDARRLAEGEPGPAQGGPGRDLGQQAASLGWKVDAGATAEAEGREGPEEVLLGQPLRNLDDAGVGRVGHHLVQGVASGLDVVPDPETGDPGAAIAAVEALAAPDGTG